MNIHHTLFPEPG